MSLDVALENRFYFEATNRTILIWLGGREGRGGAWVKVDTTAAAAAAQQCQTKEIRHTAKILWKVSSSKEYFDPLAHLD